MTWEEIFKLTISALGAVGSAGVLIIVLSSWLSKVWANRILEGDKARYAQEIEKLKLSNQSILNSLALTNSTYLESKKAFTEKRIEAAISLWGHLVEVRENTPSAIVWLDILNIDEYSEFAKNKNFSEFKNSTDLVSVHGFLPKKVDLLRPFLDEKSYQLFGTYTGVIARLCYYISLFYSNNQPQYDWRDDTGIKRIVEATFNEDEIQKFRQNSWSTSELLKYLEILLSNHLKKISSGAELANEALEHTLEFNKIIADLYINEEAKKG